MKSGDLTRLAILGWISCVIFSIGMVMANYADGFGIIIVLFVDLAVIASLWIFRFSHRLRFTVLIFSLLILHLAVFFRPENQPFANLWLGGLSVIVFIISLFVPRNHSSESAGNKMSN